MIDEDRFESSSSDLDTPRTQDDEATLHLPTTWSRKSSTMPVPSPSPPSPSTLPPGCTIGPLLVILPDGRPQLLEDHRPHSHPPHPQSQSHSVNPDIPLAPERAIWVDFPPDSRENPFHFSRGRKNAIVAVAVFFTGMTAFSTSAYSIGIPSMMADLGMTDLQALAGVGLYAFGFGIAPLVLAPLSEEFGRKWTYIVAIAIFTVLHVMIALAKNIETVLINRFLMGAAGSIGATLVGGTISDIYVPAERGMPMTVFAFCAMFGTGIGPVIMSWVEANPKLQWRWIQWIQLILMGAYFPTVFLALKETRASVILRRKARRLRKERGDKDGGRYTARSEVEKVSFAVAMRQSLLRPLTFLVVEPVVIFFSAWVSVGWGVLYTQIGGLPYIFENIYGFNVTQSGLAYITLCIGSFVALGGNLIQDSIYRRKVAKRGIEARLYAPMVAGVTLAIGCFWYGFSSTPSVHWIVPCIGLVIVIASILTIYITAFVYLSECYGSYASSAIAAQSFARNMIGGSFSFFTIDMYENLTPRWAIFLMGCIALLLAIVPFAAFWKGPQIRARSRYSKLLMEEEKRRVAAVQVGGEEAGGEDVEIMSEHEEEGRGQRPDRGDRGEKDKHNDKDEDREEDRDCLAGGGGEGREKKTDIGKVEQSV